MNDSILEEIVNEFEYILNIQSTPFQYRDNELVKYKTPFDDIIPNEIEQLQIFRDILVRHYGLKAVKKAVKKLQKKDLNKLKESIHNIPESTIFLKRLAMRIIYLPPTQPCRIIKKALKDCYLKPQLFFRT